MNAVVTDVGLNSVQIFLAKAYCAPGAVNDTADTTANVYLDGVRIGDAILPIAPDDGKGFIIHAVPSGADHADVSWYNAGGGSGTITAGMYTFVVIRPNI